MQNPYHTHNNFFHYKSYQTNKETRALCLPLKKKKEKVKKVLFHPHHPSQPAFISPKNIVQKILSKDKESLYSRQDEDLG